VFGVDFGIEIDGYIDGGHESSRKAAKPQRKALGCFGLDDNFSSDNAWRYLDPHRVTPVH
jgi:hypothetical protein